MRALIFLAIFSCSLSLVAQERMNNHLISHRTDLRKDSISTRTPMIGFTVIHGSAKSEEAELALISSIIIRTDTLYYFPEIDCASAYYFNRYLENGDTLLLERQVLNFGKRVPQEGSREMYNKWEKLHELASYKTIKVFGIDKLIDYRNYYHLLEEITENTWPGWEHLDKDQVDSLSIAAMKEQVLRLIDNYAGNPQEYEKGVLSQSLFSLLMNDLRDSFLDKTARRDSVMYENYLRQDRIHSFRNHTQFVRMGVYHMMKENFDNMYPGFLGILVDQDTYKPEEIYSVLGILSESEVLWMERDESGNYRYTTRSDGFSTGSDFFNSTLLKPYVLSDLTLFDFRGGHSPFATDDFVILKNRDMWRPLPNKSTLDYLDGVVLIQNSPANTPL